MTPRHSVRRAVPGDEDVLRDIRFEALREAPDAFASTYEREASRTTADWRRWMSPGVTFLLEHDGQIRGLIGGKHDEDDPAIVYLLAMWVHPSLRGSGAADSLVTAHLDWAREERAHVVRLDVVRNNDRALRFYERHGFRLTGRQIVRDRDGAIEVQMELVVA